jgi:membrane-bound serine protease (ClpP class)
VLHTQGALLVPFEMSLRQKTLAALSDPNIAALLMLLGMLGIGLELYHPGSLYPGAVGVVCLLLGLLATQVIPVNVGAVALLLAGAALLVVEGYVPTHGIAGVGGAICLLLGTLLFIDKGSPDYQFDPHWMRLSPLVVWPTPLAISLLMGFVAYQVMRSRRAPLLSGAPGLVGEQGEALSEVTALGGEVFVHGEYWRARTRAGALSEGSRVRVVAVDGLSVVVEADAAPSNGHRS